MIDRWRANNSPTRLFTYEIFVPATAHLKRILVGVEVGVVLPLYDEINRFDETIEGHAAPRLARIEQFTDLDNLVFGVAKAQLVTQLGLQKLPR